uniref:BPTI/Kunitz inhibitor domain-containing protein n=1 Tax=Mola mola TaxID=94237 RepID=A0A3Q4B4Y8_MOLML
MNKRSKQKKETNKNKVLCFSVLILGLCAVVQSERCGAEPDVGPCKAAFQHWYYNRETTSCQPFIYGGCSGNKNNYVSKESCTAACTGKKHTCLRLRR